MNNNHFGNMLPVGCVCVYVAAAAKLLQSCLTLCNPIDSSPPGSPVPGILQARTLEWVAISFSNCMKVKSESEVAQLCPTLRPHGLPPTRFLLPWDFPGKSTGVGCHCLLWCILLIFLFFLNFKVSPLPCHAVGPYSCKRACGRTLTCQNHTCMKECHKVTETDSCTDKKKVMSLD